MSLSNDVDQQVFPMNQLGNNDAFVSEGLQTGNQATQEALLTEDLHLALFQDENRVNMDISDLESQHGLSEQGTIGSLSIQGQGGGHSAPFQQQQQQQVTASASHLGLGTSRVMGSEATPPGDTNQQPRQNGGMLRYIIEHILGPNESNPVWRLNLIAAFSFVGAALVGVLFLPGNLEGVHATYWVLLILTVGVPMVVAVITVLVSFWLASDPEGWINWITGLSVANVSMLISPLFFYWMLTGASGN